MNRERTIDAVAVLNDFIGDFITPERAFQDFAGRLKHGEFPVESFVPLQRMCISHIALAFAKLEEFWEHYHDLVPGECRDDLKAVLKEMRSRGITEFRNRCAGHIWDKKAKRPLKHSEVLDAIERMANGDFPAFLKWVNDPANNDYPRTVVSVIEMVRNKIAAQHSILPEEVVGR